MCATCGCMGKKTAKKAAAPMKGNQSKLDKNKNGKLDKDDFKKLRSKKK